MVTGHPFRAKHGRTVARGPLYVPWSIHYDEGLLGASSPVSHHLPTTPPRFGTH